MREESVRTPQVAVGAVVFKDGKVLLVKRKNPPSAGLWAIPGGRIRWGESMAEAAEREIFEETAIKIKTGQVIYSFEVIDRDESGRVENHYIIIDVEGRYLSGEPRAGDDALEAGWFDKDRIRSESLTSSTRTFLEQYPVFSGNHEK